MLRTVIQFCVRERLVMLLALALIAFGGWYALQNVPIDAIPNIGQNQVIVLTAWEGRSPKDIEDQITYPLSVAMLQVPGAESVRGKSLFGYSFVQVTFADSVDFYWARSRVAEQLTTLAGKLPEGVTPQLGPDATGLGQVLYYTLTPAPGMNLADVRSLQDFVVKYELQAVEGVSEVASVGGYVRQYQVEADPDKLRFHQVPLETLMAAIRDSNIDVGAKTVEAGGMEFIVRGKGFIGVEQQSAKTIADIEETVVLTRSGVPVRVRDVATVQMGPAFRRGAIDLDGAEAVGGVVVMRFGENPRKVIDRVKKKMQQIEPGMQGVKFKLVYDRTELIDETIGTLTTALWQEIAITAIVIVLFLLHLRSSLIIALILPTAVLMAFIAMHLFGIEANVMSLAGIAIAIGTMVDMGIIVSENVYRHLAEWEAGGGSGGKARSRVVVDAAAEVAPAVVTAVATTVISFLPVFLLTGRDYKLFSPLAWTKTFSLIASLLVAVMFVPTLARFLLKTAEWTRRQSLLRSLAAGGIVSAGWLALLGFNAALNYLFGETIQASHTWNAFVDLIDSPRERFGLWVTLAGLFAVTAPLYYLMSRERLRPVEASPVSRWITKAYEPTLRLFLRNRRTFAIVPAVILFFGVAAYFGMPKLLQPVENFVRKTGLEPNRFEAYADVKHTLPGLKSDDWIALDEGSWFYMPTLYPAASFSQTMQVLQTQDALIRQIPEVKHVLGKIGRVESALDPAPAAMIETYVMLRPKSEWREGVDEKGIWDRINAVARLPGVTPASPLQPIEGRVVMLQSGIKAPMAIRVFGDDLNKLADAARDVAAQLKQLPQVDPGTVNPDIVLGKPYVEFEVDRTKAARYGMSTLNVNRIIEAALGGRIVTHTVEGRERYAVQVRYHRRMRERIDELERLPVVTPTGEIVPLSELTTMKTVWGPGQIASEDARLVAHVSFSPSGIVGDLETVRAVEAALEAPEGHNIEPVGSFQNQLEANARLLFIIPIVLLINLFIVYLQFRSLPVALAVFAGIPVTFAGGMVLLGLTGTELNTAVWVGFIALFGIAIDDGVVMATYLTQVYRQERPGDRQAVQEATVAAGLRRIRPCLMTTFTTLAALIPVLISTGRGADVAKAMALPVFGGMIVELISLFIVPVLLCAWLERRVTRRPAPIA